MAEQQPSILIGILTEVRGDGMEARVVKEYATETPLLTIGNEQMLAANIGSYVVIRQASIAVLAMVFKMREQDRFEQGERLSDRFFSLIPVGELKADETFIRGVRHYPTPGAKVYAVGLAEINAIFSQFRSYEFFGYALKTGQK